MLFECILKCNFFLLWQSYIFSIITPVFSVTWSFRNHSKFIYNKCQKHLCFSTCLCKLDTCFQYYLKNRKFERKAFIWNITILFKMYLKKLSPMFWTVVYLSSITIIIFLFRTQAKHLRQNGCLNVPKLKSPELISQISVKSYFADSALI